MLLIYFGSYKDLLEQHFSHVSWQDNKSPVTQKHIEIKYPWLDQILIGQIVM